MSLPVDPIMLLSVVNLKLRDQYKDLDALCEDLEAAADNNFRHSPVRKMH